VLAEAQAAADTQIYIAAHSISIKPAPRRTPDTAHKAAAALMISGLKAG